MGRRGQLLIFYQKESGRRIEFNGTSDVQNLAGSGTSGELTIEWAANCNSHLDNGTNYEIFSNESYQNYGICIRYDGATWRPLVRFSVMVILKVGDRRERGSAGGGGRYSYDEIIGKYICIINSDKNICKKICDIKQLLYLTKSVVNVKVFLKRLLSQLLEMDYNNEVKTKIIKEFTEYDIMINKSFRDLLCLEGLLISVLTHCSIY